MEAGDASRMNDLFKLTNGLQHLVTESKLSPECLNLPQIVVIGAQSVGETNVLEAIVGNDQTGTLTECPVFLRRKHSEDEEYTEFPHMNGKHFTDSAEIAQQIADERPNESGEISEQYINFKIYSPNFPHLTFIDLSEPNITQANRDFILNYIQKENILIVALSSYALQLAATVDPQRLRTIDIIAKPDMDSGADARKILQNKNHPVYNDMAEETGTKYIQARISEQLCQHIEEKLPTMRARVRKEHQRVERLLDEMNAFEQETDDSWMQPKMVEMVQKFIEDLRKQMDGLSTRPDRKIMSCCAQLNDSFYTKIYPLLDQVLVMSREEMNSLWRNMTGYHNMMSFTQQAFNIFIKRYLVQYKDSLECSTSLSAEIVKTSIENCMALFDDYPYLKQEIASLIIEELEENEEITKQHLWFHLKAQKAFMNFSHPDINREAELPSNSNASFDGSEIEVVFEEQAQLPDDLVSRAYEPEKSARVEYDPRHNSSTDHPLDQVMRKLNSYAKIISETIHDITPKYISYFLVSKTLKYTNRKLLSDILAKNNAIALMRMSEKQLRKREEFLRIYNATETALKMMNDVFGGGKRANYKIEKPNAEKPE